MPPMGSRGGAEMINKWLNSRFPAGTPPVWRWWYWVGPGAPGSQLSVALSSSFPPTPSSPELLCSCYTPPLPLPSSRWPPAARRGIGLRLSCREMSPTPRSRWERWWTRAPAGQSPHSLPSGRTWRRPPSGGLEAMKMMTAMKNGGERWRTVEQLLSVSLSGWSELEFPFRLGRDTGRGSLTRWQEDGKPHHLHPQEPSHPEPRPPSLCRCYQTQRACSDQQESYNIRVKPAEFNTHTELSWKVTCKERGRVSVGVWVCVEHWSFLFLFPSLPVMILDELKLQICSRQRNETQKRETEKRKTKKRSIRKKTYFTAAFMFSCQLLARRSHKPHPLIHKTTAPNAHHVYLRCDWLRGNSLCGLAKHLFKHL